MQERVLTYFVSDVHLGLEISNPILREKRFCTFLQSIDKKRTESLYMLGDVWDFWYEYKNLVPKGYVKVFAALVDLIESGVKVYFVKGNHDAWIGDYFTSLGIIVLNEIVYTNIGVENFCLAHGDGLGRGLYSYKFMKSLFSSKVLKYLVDLLPTSWLFSIAMSWSKRSRLSRSHSYVFNNEKEPLYNWALNYSTTNKVDYFIFGHFHTEVSLQLSTNARFYIMKDWIKDSYFLEYNAISKSLVAKTHL